MIAQPAGTGERECGSQLCGMHADRLRSAHGAEVVPDTINQNVAPAHEMRHR
jgi:hypothetical protein